VCEACALSPVNGVRNQFVCGFCHLCPCPLQSMRVTGEDKVASVHRLMTRKARFVHRRVGWCASVKLSEPSAAGRRVFPGVLDHELHAVHGPATNDWRRPKTLLFSSDGMHFQASRAMTAPSGNGSFPSRQALIATSFASELQKNHGPSGLLLNS